MKRDLQVVVSLLALLLLFFILTGTMSSGYHFTDDHEIIRLSHELKNDSVISVAARWISKDFGIRFRPVYYLHRIVEARLFGSNLFLWSFWTALMCAISFVCLYLGMRNQNFSVIESLLFVAIVLIGPQMEIWWRLGPAETLGMFFLSLAFYFMTDSRKYYHFKTGMFCLFLILSSLCKETFTIIIPAFVFFKLSYEKRIFDLSLKEALLKNFMLIVPFLVMCINLWFIAFVVGTNKLGYAGVSSNVFDLFNGRLVKQFFIALNFLGISFLQFFAILVFLTVAVLIFLSKFQDRKRFLHAQIVPFIFAFLLVTPNLIVYAKSGMGYRYLVPLTVGVAFFAISLLKNLKFLSRNAFNGCIAVICALYAGVGVYVFFYAGTFTSEGLQTGKLLSAVSDNFAKNDNVLLVADPAFRYEWSSSLRHFLGLEKNIHIFFCPVEVAYDDKFQDFLAKSCIERFDGKRMHDMSGAIDMIMFFDKHLVTEFFKKNSLNAENYTNLLAPEDDFAVYRLQKS